MALAVPADCADALHRRARAIRLAGSYRVRWLDSTQYHLTLVFLGELDDGRLPAVEALVRKALGGLGAFDCEFSAIDFFPGRSRPRVLAALPEPGRALLELQQKLAEALGEAGFRRELREYRPHITLARLPAGGGLHTGTDFGLDCEGLSFRVKAVTIFESRLVASGARYSELATIRLRAT